jgi:hypothetical protein
MMKYVDLTPFRSFGYREFEESRVETLHHRSPEMLECETPKYVNLTPFQSFGYRELQESREQLINRRSRNVKKRKEVTLWACEGRILQVLRLHFMIRSWKSQSDSQQIREK